MIERLAPCLVELAVSVFLFVLDIHHPTATILT